MTKEEQMLEQLQQQNQQLQAVLMQKQALTLQKKEIEAALASLATATSDIYTSVGPILVKTDKESVEKELTEQTEEIDLKLAAIDRQEKKTKEKMKDLQDEFQSYHTAGAAG